MYRTFIYITCLTCALNGQNLEIEPDFLKAARRLPQYTDAKTKKEYRPQISSLFADSHNEVIERAEQLLKDGLTTAATDADPRFDVSSVCLNHTEVFLSALVAREEWALRIYFVHVPGIFEDVTPERDMIFPKIPVVDAIGKPPSGLLDYRIMWLGDYDECIKIEATVNRSGAITVPYKGRYCKASFKISEGPPSAFNPTGVVALTIGVCVPNSCNEADTILLINTLFSLLPLNTSSLPTPSSVVCQYDTLEYSAKAITVIIICSIFALIMVVATAYDVVFVHWLNDRRQPKYQVLNQQKEPLTSNGVANNYGSTDTVTTLHDNDHVQRNGAIVNNHVTYVEIGHKSQDESHQQGTLVKILLSFSVYTNGKKILNVSQPPGTLTAVNGIRFISMTWVILGHTYVFGMTIADNLLPFLTDVTKRFTFQAIYNATVSVDTFFTISGLLVSYLSLKEMKKTSGAKNFKWGMFYFHRFWRLTPPYALFMMFYIPLIKYWSNGPLWSQVGIERNECESTWWKNLLYINNLFDPTEMCMAWSWYLANDMQFYVLSPLLIIPLFYSPLLGALSSGAFLLTCFISTGVISSNDKLGPGSMGMTGDGFADIYVKPWTRIGPYIIGFLTGYILYKTECKIKIPKIFNLLGWTIATTIALLVLYGLNDSSGQSHLSTGVSAFYNATHRSAWALAVCWVIVACATGNGGWVNTLLSWKALIPLSRLTYCAYLVHPVVMDVYFMSRRTLVYYTDVEMAFLFCGFLVISYAAAFVVSLAFESPMMGLEKVLLGRGKNS